ncbi:MAG TPA: hypothetical protein VLK25_10075 [Allosphingosinicella sp.]|nr:hypothetical protein [Allosphingosinicella sp.]
MRGPKLKSQRHHWWPECLSESWKDSKGCVTRIAPASEIRSAPPKNWGVIQNAHLIKIADDPNAFNPWDESYEHQFQRADDNFPRVIRWLEATFGEDRRDLKTLGARFVPQQVEDDIFNCLIECVVSLAARSPRTRDRAVSLAEHLRGPLPERKRNGLIGLNIRHFHRDVVKAAGGRGKIAVLYSPEQEFIFGDGFYHNLTTPPTPPHAPMIVAPLTPNITVLYARPLRYLTSPRLCTLIVTDEEVEALNNAVQVHSSKMIFYRNQKPKLIEAFQQERHLIYASTENFPDHLIHSVPGIPDRNREMERWLKELSSPDR